MKIKFLIFSILIFNIRSIPAQNGIKKKYYPNGKLKSEIPYNDGEKRNLGKRYYENGNLKVDYTDSDIFEKRYYENGKLKSEKSYINADYNYKEYDENGKLVKEIKNDKEVEAQIDSAYKNHLSVNLAAGLISGEVGFYYDRRLTNRIAFQLSYGHRFYSFNLIHNGGPEGQGLSYIIHPQYGDIFRIGLKKYIRIRNNGMARTAYLITSRLSYWNLHTPKYTRLINGSNGYSTSHREVISVDKNVLNLTFGIGREIIYNHSFFLDLFYCFGLSVGQKKTHMYTSGDQNHVYLIYPPNTFVKTIALFPTIELGFKVGFGW